LIAEQRARLIWMNASLPQRDASIDLFKPKECMHMTEAAKVPVKPSQNSSLPKHCDRSRPAREVDRLFEDFGGEWLALPALAASTSERRTTPTK